MPNSTALQNLNLIVRLAQREHPGAYLFQIDGRNLAPDGRARNSGAPWAYSFRTDGSGSNQFGFYDTWYVYNDGRLEWLLDHQAGRPRLGDILPSLVVDSDRALQLVKANGFQECADLPGARGFVQYRIEGGLVICEAAISGFGGLVLSADKGEILQVGGGCKP